ncbi:aldehyde dehydrogenase family protein [Gryllotalpicola ginsengisoli]|uniref:aldehyde dehydrogenase family protein n=1 Tax=Gryllotalpicola ginsengisoli TaxID=444608 RepID=UPI0003B5D676|nr:aldehyde dehydrogenase family protein [Gryllotalpicola ginsengisoli]
MVTLTLPDTEARDNETITILDPRDGSTVGTLPVSTRAEAETALLAAHSAQAAWAQTPAAERGSRLHDAAERLSAVADELAELNSRETGRPVADARAGIQAGIDTLHQYAELGPVHRGRSLAGADLAADYTRYEPRGLAVVLTPWNDPIAVSCGLIGAALVTGNTVVHKPSERCPHLGLRFGEALADAFPADVFRTVTGGASLGSVLVGDPLVDVVAHVGSSASGHAIARLAAQHGAHVVRENGGNDPLIVDAGVDPKWAAQQAALGAFANTGQICTSVERIYVHREVANAFLAHLVAEASDLTGSPGFGPLVDERMRAHVHAHVTDAVAHGATLLVGGEPDPAPGSRYPATVLTDCTPAMAVMREETFGPVAPVQVADDFEAALEAACDDRYGLAATVLTPSIAHAQQAIARLKVGTVKVNEVFGGAPGGSAQPRGESGSGFGYGPELLDEFSLAKVVHLASPGTAQED